MLDSCEKEEPKLKYFERIQLYNYYHKGKLVKLDSSLELIMMGISIEGLDIITDKEFDKEDILLLNIRFEGFPFDKVLSKVKSRDKIGEMYMMSLEFIGIPNFLFEKLKNAK